jgi:hypothetical protein
MLPLPRYKTDLSQVTGKRTFHLGLIICIIEVVDFIYVFGIGRVVGRGVPVNGGALSLSQLLNNCTKLGAYRSSIYQPVGLLSKSNKSKVIS